ncbi:MAG: hypothetical protein IH987_04630 [Planctomycetes bacterium]|nr:hypothetical protein [Planctomycetota bacterium]
MRKNSNDSSVRWRLNPSRFEASFSCHRSLKPVGCNCDDVLGGCRAAIGSLTTCITGPPVSLAEEFPDCENLSGTIFDTDGDPDVD